MKKSTRHLSMRLWVQHLLLGAALVSNLILLTIPAAAQLNLGGTPQADDIKPYDVIFWDFAGATRGEDGSVEIGLRLRTDRGFTVYKKRLEFKPPAGATIENVAYPPADKIVDPISNEEVEVYRGGDFMITLGGAAVTQLTKFQFGIRYTGCTEVICLFPYTAKIDIPGIQGFSLATANAAPSQSVKTEGTSKSTGSWGSQLEQWVLGIFASDATPLWLALIVIFIGGLVSNLTPCVYPMIPITIRILSGSGHAFGYACMYGLGIIITYSGIGLFAGLTGSMFGKFMQNPWVNLTFAALMAFLALGMLGFGNMAALQTIGSRLGAGKANLRNTFLMGIGAGLVAAPCTGPIMIALLGYAAKTGSVSYAVMMFVVYSFGFALPYVFLGASASKITKRTFSHHVQIGVKVMFAAVMFTLALYYLRIPLYGVVNKLDGIWSNVLWIFGSLGIITTIIWIMSPRLENSKSSLIIPSSIIAIALFAGYKEISKSTGTMKWHKSEQLAYAEALKSNKPIFIDGWAEWCIACIEMEKSTFMVPTVIKELKNNWILLKFDLTESTDENDEIIEKYQFAGLPSFSLVPPDGNIENAKVLAGKKEAPELLRGLKEFRSSLR